MNTIEVVLIEKTSSKSWEVAVKEAFESMIWEIGTFPTLTAAQQFAHRRYCVPVAEFQKIVPGQYMAIRHTHVGEQLQTAYTFG